MDDSSDRIEIRDILLRCIVGINEEERRERQDVVINVVMWTNLRPAAQSDSIENAVNYRTIMKQIVQLVEASTFFLVETLAEQVAAVCLSDSRVQRAEVAIEKPGALRFARSVGVRIVRTQENKTYRG
jgi:dihydroneopterin aldolase/D-erythro-7,8-dihydroneopterin triphosphate epimerase